MTPSRPNSRRPADLPAPLRPRSPSPNHRPRRRRRRSRGASARRGRSTRPSRPRPPPRPPRAPRPRVPWRAIGILLSTRCRRRSEPRPLGLAPRPDRLPPRPLRWPSSRERPKPIATPSAAPRLWQPAPCRSKCPSNARWRRSGRSLRAPQQQARDSGLQPRGACEPLRSCHRRRRQHHHRHQREAPPPPSRGGLLWPTCARDRRRCLR
mmetsp:Transcript_60289/g.173998  ORF Transcript_60289/g.173998 Transcript_60289/m.173998 type:complete len:209 (-) Transcript_60289:32-658(-)